MSNTYIVNESILLLVNSAAARVILDDWLDEGVESDIRIRRAKTAGHVVIETTMCYLRQGSAGCALSARCT